MRPAEFSDLQGLIQGLSTGIQGELDKLAKRDERQAGPVAAGRVLRLAPRPVFLAGREELLAELDARLAGGDGAGPRVVALCGLGGAGKTSVAVEYAHRHLAEVGVAWQFAAEDPAVLAAGFGELAAQLGAADGGDPVAAVHGVLAASPAPWLLVFDNAPDRASVAAFVPPAGPGRVLITSRNQIWPPGQALEVPVLDPQVAAEFLVSRTGDADRRAALELAGELGGLPLALEQAAAYVQASGDSLAGYLALFRQRRADLLGRGEPTGYPETVATTWPLAFEDLQQAAPGAAGLLRLLAFCAPEAIPLRLLLQPRPGLAEQLGDGGGAGAGAAAGGPAGGRGRDRGAAPVFADHPGRGRVGVGAPAGPGRHRRSDARRAGQAVAAGRRRPDRGRDPRRHRPARDLAGMRGAAAARPGGPGR